MASDLITSEGDLSIINGDLETGYSDEQHVEHILISSPGHYKQYPLIGVAIGDQLKAPLNIITRKKIEQKILLQLQSDRASGASAKMSQEGVLTIQAIYE